MTTMATAKLKEFEEWLAGRLIELNADEAVFGPYIQSLLEDNNDEDQEEVVDSLLGELMGPTEAKSLRSEIFAKWRNVSVVPNLGAASTAQPLSRLDINKGPGSEDTRKSESNNVVSLDSQLDQILKIASDSIEEKGSYRFESGKSSRTKLLEQPDSELRAKILSQMNASSQSDSDDDEPGTSKKKPSDSYLPSDVGRHANVSKVLNEQKEIKEAAKAAAGQKREKDKEDRAKQKSLAQEKKDKAKKKAAKVERKR